MFDEDDSENDVAYMSNEFHDVTNQRNMYVLDGGSNKSHTPDINELENTKPYHKTVVCANDTKLHTRAKGDLSAIRNVSHTPGIRRVIAERGLILQGYGIVKNNVKYADIYCLTSGKLKGRAYAARNGHWLLDPKQLEPLDPEVLAAHPEYNYEEDVTFNASVIDSDIYNHYENILFMSPIKMKQLKESNAVNGLKIPCKEFKKKRQINEAHILGNMTRSSVKRKPIINKKKPKVGHTIVGDVYGPTRVKGLKKEAYYAFFIDKGGGLNGVHPKKTKDEFLDKFQTYYAYKASIGDHIHQFESDGGKEIINNISKKWMRDKSVHIKKGAPYKYEHQAVIMYI
jgi:hypothetical protein